jgi:hypothetical protein
MENREQSSSYPNFSRVRNWFQSYSDSQYY